MVVDGASKGIQVRKDDMGTKLIYGQQGKRISYSRFDSIQYSVETRKMLCCRKIPCSGFSGRKGKFTHTSVLSLVMLLESSGISISNF